MRPRASRRPVAGSRGRGSPGRGTGPSPRSRTARSRPDWNPIVRSQNVRSASQSDGSSSRIAKREHRRRPTNARGEPEHAAQLVASDTSPTAARREALPNFVQPASATDAPRAQSDVTSQKPKRRNAGMIASFVFAFERVGRERIRGPARTRAATASRRPPKRESDRARARAPRAGRTRSRSCARRASESHFPLQPKTSDRGHVGEIGDRAVGVAALDRRLAAPVRLDALAYLSLRVLRAARLEACRAGACSRTAPRRRESGRRRRHPRGRRR